MAGLIVIAAALLALATAAVAQATTGERYVSLGDSYTAGPLVLTPTGTPIDCARSDHNYPSLVAEDLGVGELVDVSCSSAETKHMTEPQTGLPLGGHQPAAVRRPDARTRRWSRSGSAATTPGSSASPRNAPSSACSPRPARPAGTITRPAASTRSRRRSRRRGRGSTRSSRGSTSAARMLASRSSATRTCCRSTAPTATRWCRSAATTSPTSTALIRRINTMIRTEAAKHDAEFVDTYDEASATTSASCRRPAGSRDSFRPSPPSRCTRTGRGRPAWRGRSSTCCASHRPRRRGRRSTGCASGRDRSSPGSGP